MAAALFLLPLVDYPHQLTLQSKFPPKSKLQPLFISHPKRSNQSKFSTQYTCFSTSSSSSDHPSSSPQSSMAYNTQNPPKFAPFLTNNELEKLQFLENYTYSCKLASGYLSIRVMKDVELNMVVELLAESFAESMFMPKMYLTLLGFLIKQYLVERRGMMPHCVTLIGFFQGEEGDVDGEGREEELAGTVEVSFDGRGANSSPPTPTPPKDCPYICNMTVKDCLRRRGIGWHLLKASEELISNMSVSRNVHLHCRLIDSAPFNMYKKAGYAIARTDSFLVLLTLQRRKHLMCKELPAVSRPLETVIAGDGEESSSLETVITGDGEESRPLETVIGGDGEESRPLETVIAGDGEDNPSLNGGGESEPLLFDEVLQSSVDTNG